MKDGKLAEIRTFIDQLDLLRQIGSANVTQIDRAETAGSTVMTGANADGVAPSRLSARAD